MNEHTLYNGLPSDPCEEVLKFKYAFTCIVGGPSGSGKTSFVIKLIKHDTSCSQKFFNRYRDTMANFNSRC